MMKSSGAVLANPPVEGGESGSIRIATECALPAAIEVVLV